MWPMGLVFIIFQVNGSLTQLSILKQIATCSQQTETCIWEGYTNLPGTEFKCDSKSHSYNGISCHKLTYDVGTLLQFLFAL